MIKFLLFVGLITLCACWIRDFTPEDDLVIEFVFPQQSNCDFVGRFYTKIYRLNTCFGTRWFTDIFNATDEKIYQYTWFGSEGAYCNGTNMGISWTTNYTCDARDIAFFMRRLIIIKGEDLNNTLVDFDHFDAIGYDYFIGTDCERYSHTLLFPNKCTFLRSENVEICNISTETFILPEYDSVGDNLNISWRNDTICTGAIGERCAIEKNICMNMSNGNSIKWYYEVISLPHYETTETTETNTAQVSSASKKSIF